MSAPVSAADLVHAVGWLRTSAEHLRPAAWHAVDDIPEDLARNLEHLPPPSSGGGAGGRLWRANHAYAALYYRRGPGFVLIRDRRRTKDSAVYRVGDAGLLACLELLDRPTEHACAVCEPLLAEDLVVRLGGSSILLPYRLRYPPIPFLGV